MSIAVGLIVRLGFIEETILGFREIDGWKFSAPIFLGDTIHVECEVIEARLSGSRPGRGLVRTRNRVVKQDGKVVLTYTPLRMVLELERN